MQVEFLVMHTADGKRYTYPLEGKTARELAVWLHDDLTDDHGKAADMVGIAVETIEIGE